VLLHHFIIKKIQVNIWHACYVYRLKRAGHIIMNGWFRQQILQHNCKRQVQGHSLDAFL